MYLSDCWLSVNIVFKLLDSQGQGFCWQAWETFNCSLKVMYHSVTFHGCIHSLMWDGPLFYIQAVFIQNVLWNVPNFIMLLYESLQVKPHRYMPVCQPLLHYKHFNTIFTQMKGDCNLRWTTTPRNKVYVKKIYFSINFIHLIHKACEILSTFTNQCHCLHLHCHSTTYHYHSHPWHWTLHSHF